MDKKHEALSKYIESQKGNRAAIAEREKSIKNLQWTGKLTRAEKGALWHAHKAYGLDFALREIMVMGGNLYITVAGLVRVAEKSGQFGGIEYQELEPKIEGEVRYKCTVTKLITAQSGEVIKCPFEGIGSASARNTNRHIATNWLEEMAQTRALGRALRRAWPVSLCAFEELTQDEQRQAHAVTVDMVDDQDEDNKQTEQEK